MKETTSLERESLEAHVDLCAMRYEVLEKRLDAMDNKIDTLAQRYDKGNNQLIKIIIGSAGSIVAGILSLVVVILMKGF